MTEKTHFRVLTPTGAEFFAEISGDEEAIVFIQDALTKQGAEFNEELNEWFIEPDFS